MTMGSHFSRKFDPAKDLLDLRGTVVLITGGNGGIGYATVQHLARRGAKVYLAARNESKAIDAIARLHAEGLEPGKGDIVWLNLDLGSPRTAKAAAEEFLKRESRLDILINNAALHALLLVAHEMNPDGISESMIVNHFSPFAFTKELLPLLIQTSREPGSDVRIVNVASEGHRLVPANVRFDSLKDFNLELNQAIMPSLTRYGLSKLANLLWTKELQRRLIEQHTSILCLSPHPGMVHTPGTINQNNSFYGPLAPVMTFLLSLVLYTPSQGAYTSTFAAASPLVRNNPEMYANGYLVPFGKLKKPSEAAQNAELSKELWDSTESILAEIGL